MLLFIKLILAILLTYAIGSGFYRLFVRASIRGYRRVFIKLFFGLFSLITLYSIVHTSGVTVHWGLVLVGLMIGFTAKIEIKRVNTYSIMDEEFPDIILLVKMLPVVLALFLWKYYTLFSTEADIPVVVNMDSLKHSIRAVFINSTGIETGNVNYYFLPDGIEPYHYFEAWVIAIFGTIMNINFWVAGQIIALPIMNFIIVLGILGIVENWTKNYLIHLLSIGSVMFGAYYFPEIEEVRYLKHTASFGTNAFDEHWAAKLSVVYMIVIMFLNMIHNKQRIVYGIIILLAVPVVTITLAPTILTIITLLLVALYLIRKETTLKIPWYALLYPFLVAMCIIGLYQIWKPTNVFIETPSLTGMLAELNSIAAIRFRLFIGIEKIAQTAVLYFPILALFLLVFLFREKLSLQRDIRFFVLCFILIIGILVGIFFWLLFYSTFGSSQFFFYTMLPFLNILSFLLLIYVITQARQRMVRYGTMMLLLLSFVLFSYRSNAIYQSARQSDFEIYSVKYINEVVKAVSALDNKHGLTLEHPDDLIKFNDVADFVGFFLFAGIDDSYLSSITMGEMYHNKNFPKPEAEMFLGNAPFSVYIDKLKENNSFTDTESAALSFIEEFEIEFMIVSSNTEIPAYIKNIADKIISDSLSGEQLVIFKE